MLLVCCAIGYCIGCRGHCKGSYNDGIFSCTVEFNPVQSDGGKEVVTTSRLPLLLPPPVYEPLYPGRGLMKVEYCWQARYTITQQNNEEIKRRFLSPEDTDVPWQAKPLPLGEDTDDPREDKALGEDTDEAIHSHSSDIDTEHNPSYGHTRKTQNTYEEVTQSKAPNGDSDETTQLI